MACGQAATLRNREGERTGKADTVTKAYMRGNAVFADAFNYLLYDGRAVIDPHDLKEIDPTEVALPFGARDEKENRKQKEETVQKYRDLLKNAVIMEDGKTAYVLLGIENQTDIHYAMPVKNAIYDALQYGRQVSDIAAKHRADRKDKKSEKKVSDGEYLSGFYKEDRLIPVITLVIHFGAEEWDGPMTLHEMMEIGNPELLKYVQDYRIHLIDPSRLTEEELEKFSTSLREVLGYIKYSTNGKQILDFAENNPRMMMDADAARVIRTITNTPVEIPEEEERVDMCKGIEELMEDSRQERAKRRRGFRRTAEGKRNCLCSGSDGTSERTDRVSGRYKSGNRERMDFELRGDWLADKQQRCSTGRAKGRERRYQTENTWPDFTRKIDLSR